MPFRASEIRELTDRERQVLERFARGMTGTQIAADLGISRHTVSVYRRSLLRKFGTPTIALAAVQAAHRGLLS